MTRELQELQLKNALNKLQHAVFDKEFLETETSVDPAQVPETFFSFEIAAYQFVVNSHHFCEVLSDVQIASLPNSPSLLVGLCNIRGLLIPVYQLHSVLHVAVPKKNIVFCIGKGERAVGLLVNSLPVSMQLRKNEQMGIDGKIETLLTELSTITYFSAGKILHEIDGATLGYRLLKLQTSHYISQPPSINEKPIGEHLVSEQPMSEILANDVLLDGKLSN